ncbi:MAG: hypothetical protein EP332_04040 [Bacteroidetes bacterium]|nr:MAG: hypothetical protein EP332_04040 [Bacteroidota bacterium]
MCAKTGKPVTLKSWISLCFLAIFLFACGNPKEETQASIYHWKTSFTLNESDYAKLDSLDIKRLYVRFFDVDFMQGIVRPKASIQWKQYPDTAYEIVPCVYLTVKSLEQTPLNAIDSLGERVYEKVKKHWPHKFKGFNEVQLDCDWNQSTREKFFQLCAKVHALCAADQALLSCTIRLHQVKYPERTGIPPVDRGMLMCYNMGDVANPNTANSIFDVKVLDTYTQNLESYPLDLDLALPLYSWVVQFADGAIDGLHSDWSATEIRESSLFKPLQGNSYVSLYDTLFKESFIGKGDLFRIEECSINELVQGKKLLNSRWNQNPPNHFSLYHYNPRELEEHSCNKLKELYHTWD